MDDRGLSVRNFLLDEQDRIYRFPLSRFMPLMQDPKANPYPKFAGKRARCAEVVIDLTQGRPARILRMVYFVLAFDENGILNKELHWRQQMAQYNLYINPSIPAENTKVRDAKDHFLTSGGQWKPTPVLETCIRDAALGKLKCRRV